MQVNKTINGTIVISDIINGYLVTEKYIGYTETQAIKLFKKGENNAK